MSQKFSAHATRRVVLVLLGITALFTGGAWFLAQQRKAGEQALKPAVLPPNTSQSEGFSLSKSEQGRTLFTIRASRVREKRETGHAVLEDVEIVTYGAQGNRHDRIFSKLCEYDNKTGKVYSEGEVEIELSGLPGDPLRITAPKTPIYVKTSGLTFEEKTGVAATDRPVAFRFSRGAGKSVGAVYDSARRTLKLKSAVEIRTGDAVEIRAAELDYLRFPQEARIQMQKPELRRATPDGGSRELAGNNVDVLLGASNQVRSALFTGSVRARQTAAGKTSQLASDQLDLRFNEQQELQQANAIGSVHAESAGPKNRSESRADRLDLLFKTPESTLRQANWSGAVRTALQPAEAKQGTRVLTSDAVEMIMQANGEDLDSAKTLAPGRLELLPAAGSQEARRVLTADVISMQFGAESQLRTLRGDNHVRMVVERKPQRVTTSDHLVAMFSEQSAELETIEQIGSFRYTEGEQQARAERAVYTATDEKAVLTGSPQVWDAETRTSAVRITLDDRNNEGVAEQQVRTTHLPRSIPGEEKTKSASLPGPLSDKAPVHVSAERMQSNSKTGVTRYDGGAGKLARLWQKRDVIQARTIVLERSARRMTAEGAVDTVLVESGNAQQSRDPNGTVPLSIRAGRMVYTDADRRARYEEGVVLRRQDTTIRSAVLDAFLRMPEEVPAGESRLERAVARNNVEIIELAADRKRRSASEMAEFFATDERVVLSGGQPYVYDEQRGYTRGQQLTYHLRDDTIFVHGDRNSRALSEHRAPPRQ